MSTTFHRTKAAEAISELRALPRPSAAPQRPKSLPAGSITILEELFQPREVNEHNISLLTRAVRTHGALTPVVVWAAGDNVYLLDGHHRMAAYEAAKWTDEVPVEFFEGTVDDALAEAGGRNSHVRLPMTNTDKQNHAWKMEALGDYSLNFIAAKAGVSKAQVARMRTAKKTLGNLAQCLDTWRAARRHAEGMEPQPDFDAETFKDEQSRRYANRLADEFGNKLSSNTELAAMAFAIHFGRKLPDLFNQLREVMTPAQIEQAEREAEGDNDDI